MFLGGVGVILFSIIVITNTTFADFEEIYMTDDDGSFIKKNNFGWNEQPWLYLLLPKAGLSTVNSWWEDPNKEYHLVTAVIEEYDDEIWLNLANWNTIKKLGEWNVRASYFYATGEIGAGSTRFTVTPEPISSVLFLIGGAALVTRRYYRTRRIQKT